METTKAKYLVSALNTSVVSEIERESMETSCRTQIFGMEMVIAKESEHSPTLVTAIATCVAEPATTNAIKEGVKQYVNLLHFLKF